MDAYVNLGISAGYGKKFRGRSSLHRAVEVFAANFRQGKEVQHNGRLILPQPDEGGLNYDPQKRCLRGLRLSRRPRMDASTVSAAFISHLGENAA